MRGLGSSDSNASLYSNHRLERGGSNCFKKASVDMRQAAGVLPERIDNHGETGERL
jgi:hypothetical protein